MQIKQPACYDVSHYEEITDFNAITPRPLLMITKATEGSGWVDDKFVRFFDGMKRAGIRRGAYHFHRKAYSSTSQANNFINMCEAGGVTSQDILVLDVEEGGESAAQLQSWFEIVGGRFPNNLLMIYSRKNLLDPIQMLLSKIFPINTPTFSINMTLAEREFFKKIPVWTAGYPFTPDNYNSPPSSYIPDQTKWGPVWLWQYSDKGVIVGITGGVDLNWMSPDIQNWLGSPPEPPAGNVDTPFVGVTRARGLVDGLDVQAVIIEPGAIGKVDVI